MHFNCAILFAFGVSIACGAIHEVDFREDCARIDVIVSKNDFYAVWGGGWGFVTLNEKCNIVAKAAKLLGICKGTELNSIQLSAEPYRKALNVVTYPDFASYAEKMDIMLKDMKDEDLWSEMCNRWRSLDFPSKLISERDVFINWAVSSLETQRDRNSDRDQFRELLRSRCSSHNVDFSSNPRFLNHYPFKVVQGFAGLDEEVRAMASSIASFSSTASAWKLFCEMVKEMNALPLTTASSLRGVLTKYQPRPATNPTEKTSFLKQVFRH